MEAKPVRENSVHLNLSRHWLQMNKKKVSHSSSWIFDRKIVLQERWNVIPM